MLTNYNLVVFDLDVLSLKNTYGSNNEIIGDTNTRLNQMNGVLYEPALLLSSSSKRRTVLMAPSILIKSLFIFIFLLIIVIGLFIGLIVYKTNRNIHLQNALMEQDTIFFDMEVKCNRTIEELDEKLKEFQDEKSKTNA